ncbi:MAG: FAD:protein FMN transferase [Bacteroidales bacterium]|nr:FAD:protein FMN transferase [Bacteroidales bacterium]
MKRKQLIPVAIIFSLAFVLLFFYKPLAVYKDTLHGDIQGTTYSITYEDRPGRNLQPRIEQLLHKFDMSLSLYEKKSVISRINRNEKNVKPDRFFKTVFHKAEEVYHLSNGAFDITVAPLVNAWGFGPEKKADVDSALIDSLLAFVGMEKISLEKGTIIKAHPSVQIDANAIAQGYSVDIVAEFLERKGIKNYLVEIGGELRAKGVNKKGEPWKIGIDKPVDNNFSPGENLQAILQLNNKSLATSGNYRKFFEKDGVKYAHSINPKTGYPIISRLLSATVMADDCITADAFATAFMVMGLEKSIVYVSNHPELNVYLVYSDDDGNFKTFMTPGMKECIVKEAY